GTDFLAPAPVLPLVPKQSLSVPEQLFFIPEQPSPVPEQPSTVLEQPYPVPGQLLLVPEQPSPVMEPLSAVPEQLLAVPEQPLPVPEPPFSISEQLLGIPEKSPPVPEQPLQAPEQPVGVPEFLGPDDSSAHLSLPPRNLPCNLETVSMTPGTTSHNLDPVLLPRPSLDHCQKVLSPCNSPLSIRPPPQPPPLKESLSPLLLLPQLQLSFLRSSINNTKLRNSRKVASALMSLWSYYVLFVIPSHFVPLACHLVLDLLPSPEFLPNKVKNSGQDFYRGGFLPVPIWTSRTSAPVLMRLEGLGAEEGVMSRPAHSGLFHITNPPLRTYQHPTVTPINSGPCDITPGPVT
ncbi:hypothetical protein C0992_011994, partial [Termitomyces sp. T32_za158]